MEPEKLAKNKLDRKTRSTRHALKIDVKSSNVRKTTEAFIRRPSED